MHEIPILSRIWNFCLIDFSGGSPVEPELCEKSLFCQTEIQAYKCSQMVPTAGCEVTVKSHPVLQTCGPVDLGNCATVVPCMLGRLSAGSLLRATGRKFVTVAPKQENIVVTGSRSKIDRE